MRYLMTICLVLASCLAAQGQPIAASYRLDADTHINIQEGFDVELLYEVPRSQGSWVSMAFDPKGRLIVSDQDDKGVFRVTLPSASDRGSEIHVESLHGFPYEPVDWGERKVGGALGFLYAFDSLYMSTMKGFYRCQDTDGDDQYDRFTLIKRLTMGWEHSAHHIVLSEDGKAIYLVSGNYGRLPDGVDTRLPRVWGKDVLIEAMPDAMGHATSVRAPGGWICRISPDGGQWTLIGSGFRNCVDMAINPEGELFTFDSDLEFDIGCPWYRPTRICHVTSGSEFGWRNGTAKWPEYFADSVGPVLNVGPGSPTGMSFADHSCFPKAYQDKLFVCDWTFGTIYVVDLIEDGSSYRATKREFLSGSPLNIAAMRFGPDGNMYFIVGGRNTASKLYRVRPTNPDKPGQAAPHVKNQSLRDLRHSLERYHGDHNAGQVAIDKAWPYLGDDDRRIRYAARIAIENQSVDLWRDRVLNETQPRRAIYGVIALARLGDRSLGDAVFRKLLTIDFEKLPQDDRLAYLRATSLCLIRMDRPTDASASAMIAQLDRFYPGDNTALNTELCRVMSYLNAPTVVAKTIELMKETHTQAVRYDTEMLKRHEYGQAILASMANSPNAQNIEYAYLLRQVKTGWTLESRKYYFGWLKDSLTKSGGKSYIGHVRAIREDAIQHLSPEEARAVDWLIGEVAVVDLDKLPRPKGPGQAWTQDSVMALFKQPLHGRSYENGERMFSAGKCVACHRIKGRGGYAGPDLGSLGNRFAIQDIVTSILEPSKTISDQYQASQVTLNDGKVYYGKVIYRNEHELALVTSAFDPSRVEKIPAGDVKKVEPSAVSMMPPGLIYTMNADELKDLMAYLISGGNPDHQVFHDK
ncbi:MAG: c-type cytochrome [Phycisphaera sp.]|nr:c-type cytochrome [Phycisphaera sp.]